LVPPPVSMVAGVLVDTHDGAYNGVEVLVLEGHLLAAAGSHCVLAWVAPVWPAAVVVAPQSMPVARWRHTAASTRAACCVRAA
jgi:hypothetical protein